MGSYLVLADWISIHAPARGATDRRRTGRYQGYFNPRSREGSDDRVPAAYVHQRLFQSTLPRGERHKMFCRELHPPQYFNPRSREGSDQILAPLFRMIAHFNPRSREGSDRDQRNYENLTKNFNPRSREGSDSCVVGRGSSRTDFNPRSREGSDCIY